MNCEICGREITGQAFKVKVEGAKMLVCEKCQRLGQPYVEETLPRQLRPATRPVTLAPSTATQTRRRTAGLPKEVDELDLAEDYPDLVRSQRMKIGISQEELAKRVKEKLSVIQKIETGKIDPDMRLCRELEHELKVKLLVPRKEAAVPKTTEHSGVTLGDIIRVKGKSKADLKL